MPWDRLLTDFVTLLVVVDPLGSLPIFLAATAGLAWRRRFRIATLAALVSYAVLLFFLAVGQFLLEAMQVGLDSFRLAGSLVLLLFALKMVFGEVHDAKAPGADDSDLERAIFPLALPSIANPGSMLAVVVLTDNARFSVVEQARTAAVLLVVVALTWLCMVCAGPILRVIRTGGANIIERVMGLVLASLAVEGMVEAVLSIARRAAAP